MMIAHIGQIVMDGFLGVCVCVCEREERRGDIDGTNGYDLQLFWDF